MTTARDRRPHVVVVGGGVAGLAAADWCRRRRVDVTVLERDRRIGGRVKTVDIGGDPVDVGAQFIAAFCKELLAAVRAGGADTGLEPVPQHTAVVRDGAAWAVDRPADLLLGGLLSWPARLRLPALAIPVAAAWRGLGPTDLAAGWRWDRGSAQALLHRWTGDELAERFVGPMLKALLYWDLTTTSQAVLLSMLKTASLDSTVLRTGKGLEAELAPLAAGIEVRTGAAVTRVGRREDGRCSLQVREDGEEREMTVDGVVCATTAPAAATMLVDPPAATAAFLGSVTYSATAMIVYRLDPGVPPPPSSHVFPTATTSLLASVNPPQGPVARRPTCYMRVCLSNEGYESLRESSDAEIGSRALAEVRRVDVHNDWARHAEQVYCARWEQALPRFGVGYLAREVLRRPASVDAGRIVLAGDYLQAPHLEGALHSGRAAAERLIAKL